MAVRIAKINAAAALARIQLPILHAPRIAAPGNPCFLHALEDSVGFLVAHVKRIVVRFGRRTGRKRRRLFSLQRDRFNPPDFFGGERETFGLEILFHMFFARGASQREHLDLHRKPKNNLCGSST